MWKYLVFDNSWFLVLLAAAFFGGRTLRTFTVFLIFVAGFWIAANSPIDPFIWSVYFVFSLLIFWGAFQFKRWAFSRSVVLDAELKSLSRTKAAEETLLAQKTELTDALDKKHNEISHLYEKTKEMSQSLDMLEMFLIFGEALTSYFWFQSIQLAIFDEENANPDLPQELYEFQASDFQGFFDRAHFLKDRKKAKGCLSSFNQKIFGILFKNKHSLNAIDPKSAAYEASLKLWPDFEPFIAYPIFINEKIFCILLLRGVQKKELPALSILAERFISEIQRVKLYQKIETLAITDGLTDVYVRRHLMERLEGEIERCRRLGLKLSFLMIDVDNFKYFNDQYGHLVGDVVLRQASETIKKNTRELDLVGRYGGEEFGVLLVETDESVAFVVAERIRRAVQEKRLKAYDEELQVTISIGCSTFSEALNDAQLIIDAADSAMYRAKKDGKNRVCLYSLSGA